MTQHDDERFDRNLEAINHYARLGHILESRLDGHLDEGLVADIVAQKHVEHEGAVSRQRNEISDLQDQLRLRDETIERLTDRLADSSRIIATLRHKIEDVNDLFQTVDMGAGDMSTEGPVDAAGADDDVSETAAPGDVTPATTDMMDVIDDDDDMSAETSDDANGVNALVDGPTSEDGDTDEPADDLADVDAPAINTWTVNGKQYKVVPNDYVVIPRPGKPRPILVVDEGLAFGSALMAARSIIGDDHAKACATHVTNALRKNGHAEAYGHVWALLEEI